MALHVVETGPRSAPPVVFLHGAAVTGFSFAGVVARLPELHCLRVDLPGHGRSAGRFEVDAAATALLPLLRELDGRAVLVGHSMGGEVAAAAAAQDPSAVGGLVLLGAITQGAPGLAVLHHLEPRLPGPFRVPDPLFHLAARLVHVPRAQREAWAAELDPIDPAAFVRAIVASVAWRQPEALAGYRGSAWVMVAEHDYGVVYRSAEALRRSMPQARIGVVGRAPHTWHLERPRLLAEVIRAFLAGDGFPSGVRAWSG